MYFGLISYLTFVTIIVQCISSSVKMSMSSRSHLESSLSIFIDSPNGWDFFVGIKDYVQYILENPDLKAHVENLQKERKSLLEAEQTAELETKKELLISLSKIRKIVKENKLDGISEIKEILEDIESYQTNRLQMSGKFSDNLDHFLFEICRNTPEDKRFVLFKNFIDEDKEQKNIYGNFSFSSTLEDRRKLTKYIEHRDKIELWSDWIRLEKVPQFMEADSIYSVELKDGDTQYAYELIKARVEYDQNGSTQKFTDLILEYKHSVQKVHTFLIRKIAKETTPATLTQTTQPSPKSDPWLNMRQVQKEHEEAFERRIADQRQQREQRERLRIERVKADGGDQLIYAVKQLVQGAILHPESSDISVHDLGFEETINGMSNASALLTLLKKDGCIKDFQRLGNDHFRIFGAIRKKLEQKTKNIEDSSIQQGQVANSATEQQRDSSFSENPPKIKINSFSIELPPHKNEHWLCKTLYSKNYTIGELIDWSSLYEAITQSEISDDKEEIRKQSKMIYDAVDSINKRVQEKLGTREDLLTWKNKTIRRNF